MPDTTTDYARGFRAGIAAAEQKALCGVSIAQGAMDRNGPERWAYAVDLAKDIADAIRALAPAAPELNEADVERVARAICTAQGIDPDQVAFVESGFYLEPMGLKWEEYTKQARAALAAMGRV